MDRGENTEVSQLKEELLKYDDFSNRESRFSLGYGHW